MNKLPPPVIMLVGIVIEWLLHTYVPINTFTSAPLRWVGYVIIFISLVLAISSAKLFASGKTTLAPHKKPSKLIIGGPYKISRNPMYLGLLGLLIGFAAILGALSVLIVPIVFVYIMNKVFIDTEESNMTAKFGDNFTEYTTQVRRWL